MNDAELTVGSTYPPGCCTRCGDRAVVGVSASVSWSGDGPDDYGGGDLFGAEACAAHVDSLFADLTCAIDASAADVVRRIRRPR